MLHVAVHPVLSPMSTLPRVPLPPHAAFCLHPGSTPQGGEARSLAAELMAEKAVFPPKRLIPQCSVAACRAARVGESREGSVRAGGAHGLARGSSGQDVSRELNEEQGAAA